MIKVKIKIKQEPGSEDLPLPSYMSQGASGADLYADVREEILLKPGDIRLVSTGISISLPQGFEAQIRPRSGLAFKHGITLVNTPGTVDSDYRGVISLIVTNLGREPYVIRRGDRLAQMIIAPVARMEVEKWEELDTTQRESGGFGHTGVRTSSTHR